MWLVKRTDGIPLMAIVGRLWRPLAACTPMVVAVLAVRHALTGTRIQGNFIALGVEVAAGALGYFVGAFTIDGKSARELVTLAREALLRRRARVTEERNS
jgi:lipopolysaccharide exporter